MRSGRTRLQSAGDDTVQLIVSESFLQTLEVVSTNKDVVERIPGVSEVLEGVSVPRRFDVSLSSHNIIGGFNIQPGGQLLVGGVTAGIFADNLIQNLAVGQVVHLVQVARVLIVGVFNDQSRGEVSGCHSAVTIIIGGSNHRNTINNSGLLNNSVRDIILVRLAAGVADDRHQLAVNSAVVPGGGSLLVRSLSGSSNLIVRVLKNTAVSSSFPQFVTDNIIFELSDASIGVKERISVSKSIVTGSGNVSFRVHNFNDITTGIIDEIDRLAVGISGRDNLVDNIRGGGEGLSKSVGGGHNVPVVRSALRGAIRVSDLSFSVQNIVLVSVPVGSRGTVVGGRSTVNLSVGGILNIGRNQSNVPEPSGGSSHNPLQRIKIVGGDDIGERRGSGVVHTLGRASGRAVTSAVGDGGGFGVVTAARSRSCCLASGQAENVVVDGDLIAGGGGSRGERLRNLSTSRVILEVLTQTNRVGDGARETLVKIVVLRGERTRNECRTIPVDTRNSGVSPVSAVVKSVVNTQVHSVVLQ